MSSVLDAVNNSQNPSSLTILDTDNSQDLSSPLLTLTDSQIRNIVGRAHHDLLFESGNNAYTTIWNELHEMRNLNQDLLSFFKLRFKGIPGIFYNDPEKIQDIICTFTQAGSEEQLLDQFDDMLDKTGNTLRSVWKDGLIGRPYQAQEGASDRAWYTDNGQRIVYSPSTGKRLVYSSPVWMSN
ncbi:hypothetical protein JOM56_004506 [Amanita muscaria]